VAGWVHATRLLENLRSEHEIVLVGPMAFPNGDRVGHLDRFRSNARHKREGNAGLADTEPTR
jgi:hypothetical protein